MNTQDFLSIGLVGVIVWSLTEFVSRKFNVGGTQAKLVAVGLSVAFGTLVVVLQQTQYWPTIVGVLTTASTIYAMLLKKNETN